MVDQPLIPEILNMINSIKENNDSLTKKTIDLQTSTIDNETLSNGSNNPILELARKTDIFLYSTIQKSERMLNASH